MAAMVHMFITCSAVFAMTSVGMAGRPDSVAIVLPEKAVAQRSKPDSVAAVFPEKTVGQNSNADSVAVALPGNAEEQNSKKAMLSGLIARIWQATVGQVRSRPQGKITIGQPAPLQPFGRGAEDNPTSSLRGKIIIGQPTPLQQFGRGADENSIAETQGKINIGQPTPLQPFGTGEGDGLISGAEDKITLGQPAPLRPFGTGGYEGKFVWKGTGTIGRGQPAERPFRIGAHDNPSIGSEGKMTLGRPDSPTSSITHIAASLETIVLL